MEATSCPRLPTPGAIAEQLGVPLHRVTYIIDSRGIAPTATAGRIRLFDGEAVAAIADELRRIDAARGGANGD